MTLLILPFSMRESINYAIRAKLRGEKIVGAASEQFKYTEYCDECAILPTIYDEDFEQQLNILIKSFGITRFYTPHEIVYQRVKSLNLGIEFSEGSPLEIMNQQYTAMEKSGLPIELVQECGRIYGHMSEEKLAGILYCSHRAPIGDFVEIGCAWGKSLKALSMLAPRKVFAIDTWDRGAAIQVEAHPLVNKANDLIDWDMMEKICRTNVPEAIYSRFFTECAILHIDGNHDYECVKSDWETYGNRLVSKGWLILDDIDWVGVSKLWKEIKKDFKQNYIRGGALFAQKI